MCANCEKLSQQLSRVREELANAKALLTDLPKDAYYLNDGSIVTGERAAYLLDAERAEHAKAKAEFVNAAKAQADILRDQTSEAIRQMNAVEQRLTAEQQAHAEIERLCGRLVETLQLIAAPKRPDGTYNRCREACEQLAKEAIAHLTASSAAQGEKAVP